MRSTAVPRLLKTLGKSTLLRLRKSGKSVPGKPVWTSLGTSPGLVDIDLLDLVASTLTPSLVAILGMSNPEGPPVRHDPQMNAATTTPSQLQSQPETSTPEACASCMLR